MPTCNRWEVEQAAQELVNVLGKGWKPTVWEDSGWYYNAVSPCGRLKVHPIIDCCGKITGYTAYLGDGNACGGVWVAQALTPQKAVNEAVARGTESLRKYQELLRGLMLPEEASMVGIPMAEQTLLVLTETPDLRAEIIGWDHSNASLLDPTKHVGLSPSWEGRPPCYRTVLHAQHDGWRLLAPPTKTDHGWDWWLTRV